jgi:adenylyl-sulfate kinase
MPSRSLNNLIQMIRPCCYWFTGLSGAGKTTLAEQFSSFFVDEDVPCVVLDGDVLRKGLNRDLGFDEDDRNENVRRISEIAKVLVDQGMVVLVSAIAPYAKHRKQARELFAEGQFIEVYVSTDIETCILRDCKGLYEKVRLGEMIHFTGRDDPYEVPESPDFIIDTKNTSVSLALKPLIIDANYRVFNRNAES